MSPADRPRAAIHTMAAAGLLLAASAQAHALPTCNTAPAAVAAPAALARVVRIQGRSTVAAAASATPIARGDALAEGMRIRVPDGGSLQLQLADGSVVRVLAGSDVELRRLRRIEPSGALEAVIDVHRGKVQADVAPARRGRVFEVLAPGTVASVRGTRFSVSVDAEGHMRTDVSEGRVALLPRTESRAPRRTARATMVAAGQSVVLDPRGRPSAQRNNQRLTARPAAVLSAWPPNAPPA